jgi:serine/threonine protein kinase
VRRPPIPTARSGGSSRSPSSAAARWEPSRRPGIPRGRWVAIKLLRTGATDAEELDRFRREAIVVASLDHPNIAPIYDVFEHGGRLAIVMKYIQGRTLEDLFIKDATRPISVDRAVRIVRDVCLGVGFAHGRGFVHRDLKPSNLMLDEDDRVYVLDFGLVKVLVKESITDFGRMMGTPNFMSPELAMGLARDVDARTDVFSLGATLWTLLVGQVPFRGNAPLEIVRKIMRDPTPSVRVRRPALGGRRAILFRGLRIPRRATTAVEMATALNPASSGWKRSRRSSLADGPALLVVGTRRHRGLIEGTGPGRDPPSAAAPWNCGEIGPQPSSGPGPAGLDGWRPGAASPASDLPTPACSRDGPGGGRHRARIPDQAGRFRDEALLVPICSVRRQIPPRRGGDNRHRADDLRFRNRE